MTNVEPLLLGTHDTCRMLSIGRTTLFKILGAPNSVLERRKIGSKTVVTMDSIKRFVAGRTS